MGAKGLKLWFRVSNKPRTPLFTGAYFFIRLRIKARGPKPVGSGPAVNAPSVAMVLETDKLRSSGVQQSRSEAGLC